jgi:acid stress-induced BolA-like protein IbaG/YrbA
VDLKEKVVEALRSCIVPDLIDLEDDDGISGVVVSAGFRGMSALDRQRLIHKALHSSSDKFSKAELRQVLAIAALTPAEYEAVDHGGRGRRR